MRKAFLYTFFIAMTAGIIISCSKGSSGGSTLAPVDCSTITNKDFAANVNPLIQTFCNQQGCHDVASTNGPGPLTNFTQVFNARNSIRAAIQSGLMPQNTTLTTAQRNSIICWIDSGAQNN